MANCEAIQVELSAYLDGEVAPADRAALEAHLRDCAACRDALQDLESARNALAELPRLKAPKSLAAAIKRNLADSPRHTALPPAAPPVPSANVVTFEPRQSSSAWRPALLGIAAMLMAAVLIFLLLPLLTNSRQPRTAEVQSAPAHAAPDRREANERLDRATEKRQAAPEPSVSTPQIATPPAPILRGYVAPEEHAEKEAKHRDLAANKNAPPPPAALAPPSAAPRKPAQAAEPAPKPQARSAALEGAERDEKPRLDQAQQAQRKSDDEGIGANNAPTNQGLKDAAQQEDQRRAMIQKARPSASHKAADEESSEASGGWKAADHKATDKLANADAPAASAPGGPKSAAKPSAMAPVQDAQDGGKKAGRPQAAEDDAAPETSGKPAENWAKQDAEKTKALPGRAPAAPPSAPSAPAAAPMPVTPVTTPAQPAMEKPADIAPARAKSEATPKGAGLGGAAGPGAQGGAVANSGAANQEGGGGDAAGDGAPEMNGLDRGANRLVTPQNRNTFGATGGERHRIVCREAEVAELLTKLRSLAESAGGTLNTPQSPRRETNGARGGGAGETVAGKRERTRLLEVTLVVNDTERATVRKHIDELTVALNPQKPSDNAERVRPVHEAAAADKAAVPESKKDAQNELLRDDAKEQEALKKEASKAEPDLSGSDPASAASKLQTGQSSITIEIMTVP